MTLLSWLETMLNSMLDTILGLYTTVFIHKVPRRKLIVIFATTSLFFTALFLVARSNHYGGRHSINLLNFAQLYVTSE
jgi:hypothetical protein